MTGIKYISGKKTTEYGFSGKQPTKGNSFEYEKYLYIVGIIKEQIKSKGLTIVGENCLESRFFGKGLNALAGEKSEFEGFPDMAIIRDDIVVCVEHFCVNASQQLLKKGESHGTVYDRFLGVHSDAAEAGNLQLLVEKLEEEGIEFSDNFLVSNLQSGLMKKVAKIPRYIEAVREYIAAGDKNVAEEDLRKDFEVWFFVENTTPCVSVSSFPFANPVVYEYLSSNKKIAGIIYFHNPNPTALDISIDYIVFVRNDEIALEQLKSCT